MLFWGFIYYLVINHSSNGILKNIDLPSICVYLILIKKGGLSIGYLHSQLIFLDLLITQVEVVHTK